MTKDQQKKRDNERRSAYSAKRFNDADTRTWRTMHEGSQRGDFVNELDRRNHGGGY